MSYARVLEAGTYIWSDSEYLHFDDIEIPEDKINIFLAKLYDTRKDEFDTRLQQGRELIEHHKLEVSGNEKNSNI